MAAMWEIVGGADKGGIKVREGKDLKSPECTDKLSTGAVIEEVAKEGDRLHYRLKTGTGPKEGWISVRISGKVLAQPKAAPPASAPKDPAVKAGPWLKRVGKEAKARYRLVIFNWTGNRGGAGSMHNFNAWPKWLAEDSPPETWEVFQVQLPGRLPRHKEPNPQSAAEVASAVVEELGKSEGTVLFGFSFGAVLAYETAFLLQEKGERVLGVVAASAEHPLWEGRSAGAGPPYKPTKDMSNAEFEQLLRDKKGTETVLNSPEPMREMYLTTIRSDMLMEELYGAELPKHEPLSCPLVVFRGKKCPHVASEDVEAWLKCSAVGDQKPSRVEELDSGNKADDSFPWLSDWYLLQSPASAEAVARAIARDFGSAS